MFLGTIRPFDMVSFTQAYTLPDNGRRHKSCNRMELEDKRGAILQLLLEPAKTIGQAALHAESHKSHSMHTAERNGR